VSLFQGPIAGSCQHLALATEGLERRLIKRSVVRRVSCEGQMDHLLLLCNRYLHLLISDDSSLDHLLEAFLNPILAIPIPAYPDSCLSQYSF
jgi:hypothetical protein